MKKASLLLVIGVLAAFGLAACGSDDSGDDTSTAADTTATTETTAGGGGGGKGGTLDIAAAADGSFAFDQTDLTTGAGTVTVDFDNPAALSHDVVIADDSGNVVGQTDLISQSKTSTSVDLQPGTYTFYCDVPGHREGGMEGTLTVN